MIGCCLYHYEHVCAIVEKPYYNELPFNTNSCNEMKKFIIVVDDIDDIFKMLGLDFHATMNLKSQPEHFFQVKRILAPST